MKIDIITGTGLTSSNVVAKLGAHGRQAACPSPDTGVLTGEGVREPVASAHLVVDVSNSPASEEPLLVEFFKASTRHLLETDAVVGVGHNVTSSIGTEPSAQAGHVRTKNAQEIPCP